MISIYDACPYCTYFDMTLGVCFKIHENVRSYPEKFFMKCQGRFFIEEPGRDAAAIEKVQEKYFADYRPESEFDDEPPCDTCEHYHSGENEEGLCGLMEHQPVDEVDCPLYESVPDTDEIIPSAASPSCFPKEKPLPDLRIVLKKWGIGLILLGLFHLFFQNSFDPVWGAIILVLGIVNLAVPHRMMLIINGMALLFVGFFNIIGTVTSEGSGFWSIFGIIQLIWGGIEIRKFGKYGGTLDDTGDLSSASGEGGEFVPLKVHSLYGLVSFFIACLALILPIFGFIFIGIVSGFKPDFFQPDSPLALFFGFVIMFMGFLVWIGVALGIVGFLQKDKKRTFAVLGTVLNIILVIGFIMLMVFAPVNQM